ncbi:hypothetical protein COCON_G00227200 [Conger conger]|uniref:Reticulon n=1 Tax=Conger conger TaxID=82655 RepID=A0A9Q1CXH9_CONCO|nr:reticulon-1-A-like isoform X3 [Conger conger]KAJ8250798.1 hypothetical protein COCON_G00227200 [Conger conger]
MDEHVSSTTANPESEIDKLTHDLGSGDSDTEVLEDNEALAKNHVDEDDLSEPEENERHIAAEDPPKETFLESPPGPEPQEVTEPEAPLPTYSAVADSTEEPTQSDTEDTTPEPEKEETIEPTTEDTIPQPETEATTVLPEPEDIIHRPDTPTEAPVSLPKESPASESAAPLVDLLYWRDIKTTGVVFGALLFLLLSLTVCSIVSVCSYVALALLSVSISFRIYKGILQAVQKSDEGHPFKVYLDQDVALPEDSVHQYSDLALERINVWIVELRRLFLVEDLVDSLKFAVGMWVLTYVGALFNGLTLLILVLIGVFSCPVIYEKNQKQIDHYVELVTGQVKDAFGKVQAKVPGLKRKSE